MSLGISSAHLTTRASHSGSNTHPTSTNTLSTTTVFPGGASPSAALHSSKSSSVPIGAIAGGTAAGVFLAVAVVIAWAWWGRCIRRNTAKRRKEALAAIEVRENTRRNTSSSFTVGPINAPHPPSILLNSPPRSVKFVTTPSTPAQSVAETAKVVPNPPNGLLPSHYQQYHISPDVRNPDINTTKRPPYKLQSYSAPHLPLRPSPLSQVAISNPPNLPPPVPPPPRRTTYFSINEPRSNVPGLANRISVASASTGSLYSTLSGEDRASRIPQSLIRAALEKPPPVDYLSAFGRGGGDELNRLSRASAGSAGSQPDENPDVPVGFAT